MKKYILLLSIVVLFGVTKWNLLSMSSEQAQEQLQEVTIDIPATEAASEKLFRDHPLKQQLIEKCFLSFKLPDGPNYTAIAYSPNNDLLVARFYERAYLTWLNYFDIIDADNNKPIFYKRSLDPIQSIGYDSLGHLTFVAGTMFSHLPADIYTILEIKTIVSMGPLGNVTNTRTSSIRVDDFVADFSVDSRGQFAIATRNKVELLQIVREPFSVNSIVLSNRGARCVAFNPHDENELAIGSDDEVMIWDIKNNKEIKSLFRHATSSVSFHPYLPDILAISLGYWGVYIYNTKHNRILFNIPRLPDRVGRYICRYAKIVFSPDGQKIALLNAINLRLDYFGSGTKGTNVSLFSFEDAFKIYKFFEQGAEVNRIIKLQFKKSDGTPYEKEMVTNKLIVRLVLDKISDAMKNNAVATLSAQERIYLVKLILPELPPKASEIIKPYVQHLGTGESFMKWISETWESWSG